MTTLTVLWLALPPGEAVGTLLSTVLGGLIGMAIADLTQSRPSRP